MIDGVRLTPVRSFVDDRGFLSQILPEGCVGGFPVRRIYATGNFARGTVRGFHKHSRERKAFFAAAGSAKFVAVDDREQSPTRGRVESFVLSQRSPAVLEVPTGVYTGWMSLEDGTVVLGASSEPFDAENPDDERLDPYAHGDVWMVKDR